MGRRTLKLTSVYDAPAALAAVTLYELLKEREPHQNISHKELPTMEEHVQFIDSNPYKAWYLLSDTFRHFDQLQVISEEWVGSIYLTYQREVGLWIFKKYQGQGCGTEALALLRKKHPGRLLANVNPQNSAAFRFWERNGFRVLQHTYLAE